MPKLIRQGKNSLIREDISDAPAPGVLMLAEHAALKEVRDEVNRLLGEEVAVLGMPIVS